MFATEERGVVTLTFDLPASSLLEMNLLLLLLAFESPAAAGDLEVTFSSRFLLPHSQVKKKQWRFWKESRSKYNSTPVWDFK